MADYATWKVADLKAELKRRGIPQTGLRVKQNFIDRLVEEDAKGGEAGKVEEPAQVKETTNGEEHANDPQEGPEESQGLKSGEEEGEAQGGVDGQKQDEPKPEGEEDHAEPQVQVDKESQQAQPVEAAKETQPEPEDAPAPTSAPEDVAQQPTPPEPVAPTDKIASSIPSTELSTPLPPEEALEDSRKRKRRSKSPVPEADAITNKKARAQDESPRVLLPEDPGAAQANRERNLDDAVVGAGRGPQETQHRQRRPSISEEARGRKGAPLKQDARFRDLFAPAEQEPTRPASPPRDAVMEDTQVEPSSHSATAALYVDGLMRPLQPMALRNHLVSIASTRGSSPNSEIIQDFYLDSIKTHCFVSFADVFAASRARSALHGTVWPNERNRKALFVDFIPEHKVQEWIQTEDASRNRRPPPRWEIKYEQTDEGVEATLEEVDPRAAAFQQARGQEPVPPRGPRGSIHGDRRPSEKPPTEPERRPGQGFKPLDDLFMSTTAKPKLYYLPVPRETADRRLDRFDDMIQKGAFPRPGGDENRRITFEDRDLFADKGPEFGARYRGRGPPPGRGRGRGRGIGDSWRGRH